MEGIDLITVITIALLGSFGHCIGMCGGVVIAYSSSKIDDKFSKLEEVLSHLSYSFGRILTYAILGAIFGFLGGVITFDNIINGVLYFIAGSLMILVGLSLAGGVKFLTSIEYSISSSSWFKREFQKLISSKSKFSFFMLGMLNGLIPCGFVYFFAITAASSGSALWGALIMAVLGLATVPALFALGYFVGVFKQTQFREVMMKLASISVVAYGFYTIYRGYIFIFDPSASLTNCH